MKCIYCNLQLEKDNFHEIFDDIGLEWKLDELVEKYFGVIVLKDASETSPALCGDCVNQLIELFDSSERDNEYKECKVEESNDPAVTKESNYTSENDGKDLVDFEQSQQNNIVSKENEKNTHISTDDSEGKEIIIREYLRKVINTDLENISYEQNSKCNKCLQLVETHQALLLHAISEHQDHDNHFTCIVCNSKDKFSSTKDYACHVVLKHYDVNNLSLYCVCPECERRFSDFIEFQKHSCCTEKCPRNTLNECKICNKEFPSHKRLKFHVQFHQERQRPKICFICETFFEDGEEFFEHVMYYHLKEGAYVCNKCDRVCSNENTYKAHLSLHDAVRQFCCNLCPKKYMYKQLLTYHMDTQHSSKELYKCEQCDKVLGSKTVLRKHMKLHSNDIEVTVSVCSKCGLVCIEEEEILQHITDNICSEDDAIYEEKTLKTAIVCEYCEKAYSSVPKLREHRLMAHLKKKFMCFLCSRSYNEFKRLKTHMMTHKDFPSLDEKFPLKRVYACDFEACEQVYPLWTSLRNHKRSTHERGLQLVCSPCNKQFKSKWQLNAHLEKGHAEVEFECQFCNKIFPTQMSLSVHVARKHNNNYKTCSFCEATCKDEILLQYHIDSVHTKVKCEHCNKWVKSRRNLEIHIRMIHSDEKRYFCGVCSKGYYNRSDLRVHEKTTHKDEKPFKCDQCPFATFYEKSFEVHMSKHNNTCPFKCPICSREFTRKICMTLHIRRHNVQKPFVCEEVVPNGCKANFVSRGILNKHIREKHETTLDTFTIATKRRKKA